MKTSNSRIEAGDIVMWIDKEYASNSPKSGFDVGLPYGSLHVVESVSLSKAPDYTFLALANSNFGYYAKRFVKVDPATLSKLEREIYGI